jgi:hypothetical protein
MPTDPFHPDQLDGEQRFRADLVAYLDSLPVGELAELLGELPSSRQQLGVLMVALNERLPDAYKLLRPQGASPARVRGGAARCGRWSPTGTPPATSGRRRRTAVAEALHAMSADPDPPAGHPRARRPAGWVAGRTARQGEERDSDREDDFGDSWRTYRERADHIRQIYGWTVLQRPPHAENWLTLGHDDEQEHAEPPGRSRRWFGEDRDPGDATVG